MDNFGNKLYGLVDAARYDLFQQGEFAQLTYSAFDAEAGRVNASEEQMIQFTFPVGWRADNQPINSTRVYEKGELLARYQFLAYHQLAINGIIRLAAIIEDLLGDIVRALVLKYPKKLGAKRTVPMHIVLEATSIEDVHVRATDALLYDLSYKSPAELAEELKPILSFNLLECPGFHKFVEIKATRDIHVHNRGMANDAYVRKAGSHARVRPSHGLPVDVRYFLESYETCLQLTEWIEGELHDRWHSSDCEQARERQLNLPLPTPPAQGPSTLLPSLKTSPDVDGEERLESCATD